MTTIPTSALETTIQGDIPGDLNKTFILRMGRVAVKVLK